MNCRILNFAAHLLVLTLVASHAWGAEPTTELLWPDGAPQAKGDAPADKPTLTIYLPEAEKATGSAVVICPGGGYGGLAIDHEGHQIARWLNSLGVAGFIVEYRHRGKGYGHPAPLQDAQRAIRTVRARASQWKIDPGKIGIMGFSAGGHLAACAATMFEDQHEERPELAKLSPRPDFCALIYPVVTFLTEKGHSGTQRALLGESPAPELLRRFSPEANVSAAAPSTFLLQAVDDSVPVENSLLFFNALRLAGVPVEMHIYAQGGHGYGMRKRGLPIDNWPDRLRDWALDQLC